MKEELKKLITEYQVHCDNAQKIMDYHKIRKEEDLLPYLNSSSMHHFWNIIINDLQAIVDKSNDDHKTKRKKS